MASVGGIGVAVGLATQSVASNVVSALSLFASRPFVVGDRVQLLSGGAVVVEGLVEQIEPMRTVLRDAEGNPSECRPACCTLPCGCAASPALLPVGAAVLRCTCVWCAWGARVVCVVSAAEQQCLAYPLTALCLAVSTPAALQSTSRTLRLRGIG